MSKGKHALLAELGSRIRALRKAKKWTQTDMAVHLDVNRGHISDVESGKREVGLITLVDPEKVTFRQVEAEYRGLAGLSG